MLLLQVLGVVVVVIVVTVDVDIDAQFEIITDVREVQMSCFCSRISPFILFFLRMLVLVIGVRL